MKIGQRINETDQMDQTDEIDQIDWQHEDHPL